MPNNMTWIEEQKKNRLFRGSGHGSDAAKMLEISQTNRIINTAQARKLIAARYLSKTLKIKSIDYLCDLVEAAQLCVDAQSRQDFMKVAIEQWQGKLASAGRNVRAYIESMV